MQEAAEAGKRITWTAKGLDAKRVAKRTDFTDSVTPGLVLRVTPTGTKTWAFLYRRKGDGEKRRFTIGPYRPSHEPPEPESSRTKFSLSEARERAALLRAEVIARHDPAAKVAAIRRAETVNQLLDQFLAAHPRPDAAWTKECKRIFNKDVRKSIGALKLPDLTRQHVRRVLNAVKDRGATATVNRTLAALRRAFSWALSEDLIAVSPAQGIATNITEVPKDRALTMEEIRRFWNGLDAAPVGERTRLALKLVLVTGQRPGEVCGARIDNVDLASGIWTLPKERTKNRQAHAVPLSGLAKALLQQAMSLTREGDFIFETRSRALDLPQSKALESHALSHALRDSLESLGMKDTPFTPHDLRRTTATHMARLGIPDRTVAKVLNHGTELRRTITARVYIQHDYMAEKKDALERWALEIKRAVAETSDKVVEMKKRS